jgi:hypothetical protein
VPSITLHTTRSCSPLYSSVTMGVLGRVMASRGPLTADLWWTQVAPRQVSLRLLWFSPVSDIHQPRYIILATDSDIHVISQVRTSPFLWMNNIIRGTKTSLFAGFCNVKCGQVSRTKIRKNNIRESPEARDEDRLMKWNTNAPGSYQVTGISLV